MAKSEGASWEDLPSPLLEIILELLSLPDYLRFAGVCSLWRETQTDHRHRHAASPRYKRDPWLINTTDTDSSKKLFYSPSEQRYYHISLPKYYHFAGVSKHGWLLLVEHMNRSLLLVNPITGTHIPISLPLNYFPHLLTGGDLSSTPSDPECVLLYQLKDGRNAPEYFYYRFIDKRWTKLNLGIATRSTSIIFQGKFYWLLPVNNKDLVEIDLLSNTVPRRLTMDVVKPVSKPDLYRCTSYFLVECNGDLLLTMFSWTPFLDFTKFQVFKADWCRKEWVRLESLGDHILFLCSRDKGFSLSAAQTQGNGNHIYFNFKEGPLIEYDYSSHQSVQYGRKGYGINSTAWVLPSL